MKNIILFVFSLFVLLGNSCQDVTIGYLFVQDAAYNPDSLVIRTKSSLDVSEGTRNPAVEEFVIDRTGMTLDEYMSMTGLTYETVAQMTGLEAYVGRGEDYDRCKWGMPWVSTPIEGIDGTPPIYVSIKEIKSLDGGDAIALDSVLTVRGNGTFEIPLYHDVPVGRYVISLNFRNEGYSKDVDDCFTIIVK